MSYKKLKLSILIIIFLFSFTVTMAFIITTSLKNHNLKPLADDYANDITPIDDTSNNLNPDIVFSALEQATFNQAIEVKLTWHANKNLQPTPAYIVKYNCQMLQYLFLKQIIRTLPQWKTNYFTFKYDNLEQNVWVKYQTNENSDYLNWFFQIVNKT